MKRTIVIRYSDKDGSFLAEVPSLPGCVADGATPTEALQAAMEAAATWEAVARELGREVPPDEE